MKLLPHIPKLEEFLSDLSRVKRHSEYKSITVAEQRNASTHDSRYYSITSQKLWYKNVEEFTIKSARDIIHKALTRKQHRSSDQLISSILLLYTYLPKKQSAIDTLEIILNSIQKNSIAQYYLLNGTVQNDLKSIKFGEFYLGKLDVKQFEYRCKKATSDFYTLYKNHLENKGVIERDFFEVHVINWANLSFDYEIVDKGYEANLLIFFEKLSTLYFTNFWDEFKKQQYLQICSGIEYLDYEIFTNTIGHSKVSIYSNIKIGRKKVGYVVPQTINNLAISWNYKLDKAIRNIENVYPEYFSQKQPQSEIYLTIQSFITFCGKAHIFLTQEKTDEGFLHFVIAIDLLLGEKRSSVQSVSKRTAVLTFKSFDNTYQEQVKFIQKIYDARSKYVHRGKSVDIRLLKDLKLIVRIILDILLNIQSQEKYKTEGSFEKWVKELDFIVGSIEADREQPASYLKELGLIKISPRTELKDWLY